MIVIFVCICLVIITFAIVVYYFYYECTNRVHNMVTKYANHANNILDLGCGACCSTKKLKVSGKNITPLDVVNKGKCMKPELFDGKRIPYGDKEFDLGICSFVLHHATNQLELLLELKRTCKQVLIIENTPESEKEWKYALQHAKSDWGQCKECFRDNDAWKKTFTDLDLSVLAQEKISRWLCPFSDKPFFYPVTCTVYLLESRRVS